MNCYDSGDPNSYRNDNNNNNNNNDSNNNDKSFSNCSKVLRYAIPSLALADDCLTTR